ADAEVAQEFLRREREIFTRVVDALDFLVPVDQPSARRATDDFGGAEEPARRICRQCAARGERESTLDVAGAEFGAGPEANALRRVAATLGGDVDDASTGAGPVERSGRGTLHNLDVFDVVRVD